MLSAFQQLSPILRQFWRFLLAYSLATIVVGLVHGYFHGPRAGLVAFGFMSLLLLLITTIGQPWFIPYRIRHWQVKSFDINAWPHQDFTTIGALSETLRSYGFQTLQDYCPVPRGTIPIEQHFVRCFGHDSLGCFAEVGMTFSPDTAPRVTHIVFFTIFADGWMLIDGTHLPKKQESLIYAWRNQREVRRHHPNITIEGLYQSHFATQQEMWELLNIEPRRTATWDLYQTIQRELIAQPWAQLRQRNLLLGMIAATQFELKPRHEWLGAYRPILQRRRSLFDADRRPRRLGLVG
jgi:hypothetical protein